MKDAPEQLPESSDQVQPSIRLEFFRHGIKGSGTNDNNILLTPEGRIGARESGKNKHPNPHQGLVFGSSRKRSQEAGLHQFLSFEKGITVDMTLQDINAHIDEVLKKQGKLGKKVAIDERLNFINNEAMGKIIVNHIKSKDLMLWLFEESDHFVKEIKDKNLTSYSRIASNIARIIQKYIKILPRWQQLQKENSDNYPKKEMQRFMGSHGGVLECFLIKVIEKQPEGKVAAKKFIDTHTNNEGVQDTNQFDFNEGYSIILSGENQISLTYKEKIYPLTTKILDDIISEGSF